MHNNTSYEQNNAIWMGRMGGGVEDKAKKHWGIELHIFGPGRCRLLQAHGLLRWPFSFLSAPLHLSCLLCLPIPQPRQVPRAAVFRLVHSIDRAFQQLVAAIRRWLGSVYF